MYNVNIVWNERYNIGVETVDKAHRQLFSIIRKIFVIIESTSNIKHSCEEGIKYLKNYAIKHFAEEEAYMKLINYKGYIKHKKLHDEMLRETIPKLEKDLLETNYSNEAVNNFLGVCLGWLTGHIMIEDRAITGIIEDIPKIDIKQIKKELEKNKLNEVIVDEKNELQISTLEKAISNTVNELFNLKVISCDRHYKGNYQKKSIYYRLLYSNKSGKKIKILMVLEEKLLIKTVGKMMDMQFNKIDSAIISAATKISQQIINRISKYSDTNEFKGYKLERDALMNAEHFSEKFMINYFNFSLLFNTDEGSFAFVLNNYKRYITN